MAISVQCPDCKVRLKMSGTRAGSKIFCPRCGGAMLVPQLIPDDQPSLLPKLAIQTETSTCAQDSTASPRQSTSEKADADDEAEDIPRPLTQQQRVNAKKVWRLITIITVAAISGGAIVYLATVARKNNALKSSKNDYFPNFGPLSLSIDKTCSLSELSEHLLQNKLGSNVMYVSLTAREAMPYANITKGKVPSAFIDGTPGRAKIMIFECEDDLSAKHGTRRMITTGGTGDFEKQKNLEKMAFSWGRFGFVVLDESIAIRIKRLLKTD